MPKNIKSEKGIRVGDFYENCAFHPCLCISIGKDREIPAQVEGISLVDGSVKGCNARHCGLRLLTLEEAIYWKFYGPADQKLEPKDRWWEDAKSVA